jgi:hypothetical protein
VAALDELVAVFKKNFQEYANNERRRHARRPNLIGGFRPAQRGRNVTPTSSSAVR